MMFSTANLKLSNNPCLPYGLFYYFDNNKFYLILEEAKQAIKDSHKCIVCDKEYAFMSVLKKHIISHGGEKPYSCKTCGRKFARKSDRDRHERIHTEEKPPRHKAIDCEEKPYDCEVSGKSFRTKDNCG